MDYHILLMPYFWSILIDIGIYLPFYVPPKYTIILHVIFTSIVSLTTMVTASQGLYLKGIPSISDSMFFHKLIGVVIFALIVMQIILGVLSKLNKSSQTMSSSQVLKLRKVHTYCGYFIVLLAKLQVLKILK